MSTATESQTVSPSSIEAATSSKEKVTLICKICEATISDDDTKLICTNENCDALTCNTCINVMLEVMLGQPALNYPLTCGACANSFPTTDIDQILMKHQHYEQFIACVLPLFWSDDCLEETEKLAQCKCLTSFSFFYLKKRILLNRSILSLR